VAGSAGAGYLRMIDGIGRRPYHVVMAVFTDVGRSNVSSVLARRASTVMATDAVANDAGVIKIGGNPGNRRVAVVAVIAALHVRRILARGDRAVMAGSAAAGYLSMVDGISGRPERVVVAVLTNIGRIDVRRILAASFGAVVASETVVADTGMVEPGWRPYRRLVTILAVVAGRNVVRRLASRSNAIVTGAAATGHRGVIHECDRAPGSCCMTVGT
jgi:hypothetical protein